MARNNFGFPTSIGSQWLSVGPHSGPASYTQVTTGPIAGGDSVAALDLGMKFINSIQGGITDDGLYRVEPIPVGSGDPVGAPMSSVRLRWTVVATGAQVAAAFDLSGSVIRLQAIGI